MDNEAIVTVHFGSLTDEERRALWERAAKEFYKAILKAKQQKGNKDDE